MNGEVKFVTKEVTPYRSLSISFYISTSSSFKISISNTFMFASYDNSFEESSVKARPNLGVHIGHIRVLDVPFFPVLNQNPSDNLIQSFISMEEKALLITIG